MQATPATDMLQLRGRVAKIFYTGDNFCAGRFVTDDGESVTFSGSAMLQDRQHCVLHGYYTVHKKYGRQFSVKSYDIDRDMDVDGLANYLANDPRIKGIGPIKARMIANAFGSNFESVLINHPEEIATIANIPQATIDDLREQWVESAHINSAMVALSAYGLTYHQVTALVAALGENAVNTIEHNPYSIIGKVEGFGFKRVDDIARAAGTARNDPGRIRAGIVYCVDEALDKGDCWVEYNDLVKRAEKLLILDNIADVKAIETHLDDLIDGGDLHCEPTISRLLVSQPAMHAMEVALADVFRQAHHPNPLFQDISAADVMAVLQSIAPSLNDKQTRAIMQATGCQISLITGGAGSGKTFVVSVLVGIADKLGIPVMLCAPTGKAAKRMEQLAGKPAMTIHRMLGYNGYEWSRSAESPLSPGLIIVDEFSMVDVPLAWHLFQAVDLRNSAVVVVGDHNQLPPVGAGNILRDLTNSEAIPTTVLTDIVRQAGILDVNSRGILDGTVAKSAPAETGTAGAWYVIGKHASADEIQQLILTMFDESLSRLGYDILRDVQLLTPTHKGPIGTMALNAHLQRLFQRKLWGVEVPCGNAGEHQTLMINDKVIQTKNDYDLDVMNGTTGIVEDIDEDGTLTINFDGKVVYIERGSKSRRNIQLAYALTIHKSQGSEYPCSIVVCHKSHSFMHHRNLLYTGVTRASQTAIIVGDHWGIANCAKRMQVEIRKTLLSLVLPNRMNEEDYIQFAGAAESNE